MTTKAHTTEDRGRDFQPEGAVYHILGLTAQEAETLRRIAELRGESVEASCAAILRITLRELAGV